MFIVPIGKQSKHKVNKLSGRLVALAQMYVQQADFKLTIFLYFSLFISQHVTYALNYLLRIRKHFVSEYAHNKAHGACNLK
jgi:hypothetical protein